MALKSVRLCVATRQVREFKMAILFRVAVPVEIARPIVETTL
jgi:hypothetical protein